METTVTLRVPFILLGRRDFQDPDTLWSPEDRYRLPAEQVYQALRKFCHHVPVRLSAFDEEYGHDAAWLIQPMLPAFQHQFDVDQSARLGKNIWSCAMQLQRSHIPLSSAASPWHNFKEEAKVLFETLRMMFVNFQGPIDGVDGPSYYWNLVTDERCWLRISLSQPLVPRGTLCTLDAALVKKVLMTFTAVERELTLPTTPTALLQYWFMSRFLEYRAMRKLGEEKDLLWMRLKDKIRLTDKRKGTMYQRDKEKWLSGLEQEDSACHRTKGRRKEWFDVVHSTDTDELIEDMRKFEERGGHLAVSCKSDIVLDDTISAPDSANLSTNITGARAFTLNKVTLQERMSRLQENRSQPPTTKIVITSHRSTLCIRELLSYVELVTSLLHLACTLSYSDLVGWLEKLRASTAIFPDQPVYGLGELMQSLRLSNETKDFWINELRPLFVDQDQDTTSKTHINQHQNLPQNPFLPFASHVDDTLASERAYIPTFISRYQSAGGFHYTKGRKLYALLLAKEHESKKRHEGGRCTRSKDWLARHDEIKISDAIEPVEDLYARAPKSPELIEDEKGEKDFWIEAQRDGQSYWRSAGVINVYNR